jgi:hypothetical protein
MTRRRLITVESGIIATWVRSFRAVDVADCARYGPRLVGQQGPANVLGKAR